MDLLKRHPYVTALVAATILSVVVWCLVPKEYAAHTKVIDEYKEVDLNIGLNSLTAKMRDLNGSANKGINDIEVYCKLLETDDFARKLAGKRLSGKNITYGEYLAADDTVGEIKSHIEYNLSTKQQAITIQFTDKDALVAAQMLDTTVVMLQEYVTQSRRSMAEALLKNAKRAQMTAAADYRKAQKAYADYMDTHMDEQTAEGQRHAEALKNEVSNTFKAYQNVALQYARQKALTERTYMSFAVVKTNTVPQKTNSHFLGYFLAFLIPALALTKGIKLYHDRKKDGFQIQFGNIFSPWGITISIWCLMFIGLAWSSETLYPVSRQFWVSITIWITVLVVSSLFTFNLLPARNSPTDNSGISLCMPLFNMFFYISLLLTPLYVYEIYKIVSMFDMTDMMKNVRLLAIKGDDGYGILNYTSVINQALLFIAVWRYPKLPLWKLCAVIVCGILCALAKMEKITVFMVLVTIIYVLYERRYIKIRTIAFLGIGIVLLFFGINLLRDTEDGEVQDTSIVDFLCMYITSAPVAFGYLRQNISDTLCPDSLWVIYNIFEKIFLGAASPHEKFETFVFVPIATNVYTVLRPFYQDAGYIGVAYFALVYGILSGYIYRLARNGSSVGICLYGYIVFILSLQFFDEMLFAALSQNIQRALLIILICQNKIKFTIRKRPYPQSCPITHQAEVLAHGEKTCRT